MNEQVLNFVYNFYLDSHDYNGVPITTISTELNIYYLKTIEILKELLFGDLISVQNGDNPHIVRMGHFKKEVQTQILDNAKNNKTEKFTGTEEFSFNFESDSHLVCVYPSKKYLEDNRDITEYRMSPYTGQLALGQPQLKPIFFDIEVLERYSKDPRFYFEFEDYSGRISYNSDDKDVPLVKANDQIFVNTFGLGMDDEGNRLAVVYLRYLHNLTPEHQLYWQSKETGCINCQVIKEYYENTLVGMWTNSYSIFSGFIGEHKALNDLSLAIFGINLFNKTFEEEKRPREFTFFMMPTLENYNSFILLLDKMISDNLNKKFFDGKVEMYNTERVDKNTVERKPKGTLALFEEWLSDNYNFKDKEAVKVLFKPLRNIRKERQHPAHNINENIFDKTLIDRQKAIIDQAYDSIRNFRHIFQAHRKAKDIVIPEWLDNGKIKIF